MYLVLVDNKAWTLLMSWGRVLRSVTAAFTCEQQVGAFVKAEFKRGLIFKIGPPQMLLPPLVGLVL